MASSQGAVVEVDCQFTGYHLNASWESRENHGWRWKCWKQIATSWKTEGNRNHHQQQEETSTKHHEIIHPKKNFRRHMQRLPLHICCPNFPDGMSI
jgi:hypothetical protein